ncbi:MAG TPA: RDD family protein [Nocardioides sp.]|nr:RDD family protein [Nocardioides sp.]
MTEHAIPASFPAAELDRRFYAFSLDRLVAWSVDAVVAWVIYRLLIAQGHAWAGGVLIAATVLLVGLAFAVLTGLRGTSPGRAAFGLRVVHHGTGTPIGVGPAVVRSLVLGIASLPTFGLGAVTLAWTAVMDRERRRRGWHDHLAGSIVVDVRPGTVEAEETTDEAPRHIVNLTAMRLVRAPTSVPEVPAPSPAPTAGVPAPVAAETRWRVTFDSAESFVVEGLVLVGRQPEPRPGEPARHLVPLSDDLSVSKTHAQLQVAPDGALVVMDRGSTNGTILVRRGVPRRLTAGTPTTLLDGDQLRFGDHRMTIGREY